jgi:hypothetical protein
MPWRMRAVVGVVLLALAGCGSGERLHAVEGRVTGANGKGLPDVRVVFIAKERPLRAHRPATTLWWRSTTVAAPISTIRGRRGSWPARHRAARHLLAHVNLVTHRRNSCLFHVARS